MPPPFLARNVPFPPAAFPFVATVYPSTWTPDADGAPGQSDGAGVTLACDVQFSGPTGETVRYEGGPVPQGVAVANLVFRGRPAPAIGPETWILIGSGPLGAYETPERWQADGDPWDRGSGLWG